MSDQHSTRETHGYPATPAPLSAFPHGQLFLRQRVEERVGNNDLSLEHIGLALDWGLVRYETRDRLAAPRDHDLLAGLDPRQQSGKLGLGLMDIDNVHGIRPRLEFSWPTIGPEMRSIQDGERDLDHFLPICKD